MKRLIVFFTAAFFFSCSDNTFNNDFLTFEVRLADSAANPALNEMILYNSEQKFYVHDTVYLANNDIKSTEVIDWQTQPKILVNLSKAGQDKFAQFTGSNIGKNAAIIVDEKLVSAPKINARISSGQLIIVGYFTHGEAQKITDGISGKN